MLAVRHSQRAVHPDSITRVRATWTRRAWAIALAVLAWLGAVHTAGAQGPCNDAWLPTALDAPVSAVVEWDPDGPGPRAPQVVAGGFFSIAGGITAQHIARWNSSG